MGLLPSPGKGGSTWLRTRREHVSSACSTSSRSSRRSRRWCCTSLRSVIRWRFIAGGGNVNKIYLGALLELLLIIANIGTAVVIVPIMRRQFEELSIGYVTARLVECTFILVGIVAMLGIATLQQESCGRGRRHCRVHPCSDQRLDVPARAGLGRRLGERVDSRLHDVPDRARAPAGGVARARGRPADHHLRNDRDVRRRSRRAARSRVSRRSPSPCGSSSSASTAPSGASGAMPRSFPEARADGSTRPGRFSVGCPSVLCSGFRVVGRTGGAEGAGCDRRVPVRG